MPWYDNDYGYKKKITIDHTKVGGDETDFPVLISVTDNDLRDTGNGGHVQSSSGYDIIFTNGAESAQLNHEIELYVNTSGQLVYWVKVPSLSSTVDTDIYIYYGKAGVVVDPSSTSTWDSNFVGVWHMDEAVASARDDSTSYGNDAAFNNGNPDNTLINGKIGKSIDFNDGNEYYETGSDSSLNTGTYITIECWIYVNAFHNYEEWYQKGNDWYVLTRATEPTDSINVYIANKSVDEDNLSDATWYHVVATGTSGGNIYLYINGSQVDSDTGLTTTDNTETVAIGKRREAGRQPDGSLDECRLSNSVRSGNWIGTEYENQNSPGTFMSFGAEQEKPSGATGSSIYYWDGSDHVELQRDDSSPVQLYNGSEIIGLKLGDINDADASPIHVFDGTNIKAILKMP